MFDGFTLDKDIIVKNSKIYSPETCCFVPIEINQLFVLRKNDRTDLPIGVTFSGNKYFGKFNNISSIGFDNPEDAFMFYKNTKTIKILNLAEKWKDKIMPNVYNALINYYIEITD